ncbi:hypothetical protein HRI_004246600 [Hibiscus trionum]|uniref:Transmembrane protein n=1 Tax=Hibiscus trionum TaxID=183268 RepID=A0A9W7J5M8_HIBTR|nr:hypothetical protein HRI_004246600 [Hibiscus trionum]
MLENDGLSESLLFEWDNLNSINHQNPEKSSKSKPNPQIKQQWSMVMIRDSLPRSDLAIFPPINHENLHHQNPLSESPLLPPSAAASVIQSSVVDRGIGDWLGIWLQISRAKIVSLAGYLGYENGTIGRAFRSFRGVVNVAAVLILWWFCKRIRRGEGSVERLKRTIKEKDEKIVGLLNQIAEMKACIGSTS